MSSTSHVRARAVQNRAENHSASALNADKSGMFAQRALILLVSMTVASLIGAGSLAPVHAYAAATGEWPLAGRDAANTRYSELGQITPANVKNLKLAFTFSTG